MLRESLLCSARFGTSVDFVTTRMNRRKVTEMIGLDRLMEIKGVVAAGQFTRDGKILRAVGDMDERIMQLTAQMCAKQTDSLESATEQFGKASRMKWQPLLGWAVWGGRYAIMVMGNTALSWIRGMRISTSWRLT